MASGGARINSGPPPDPNALARSRRTDQLNWTLLPSAGRPGPAPVWPLMKPDHADADLVEMIVKRERSFWKKIWSTPQAVAWEKNGWGHDVALYCRWLAFAETGNIKAGAEARQWSDRLGLNPAAMLRNRWRIADDEVAPRRTTASPPQTSARDRLKAVAGGNS